VKKLGAAALVSALISGCSSTASPPSPTVSSATSPTDSTSAPANPTQPRLLVGARARDIPFETMEQEIGPVHATRVFYTRLPPAFDAAMFPRDVKVIVSYKQPSANTTAYVQSIPAGYTVEMAFHHEPEGPKDYPGPPSVAGPRFVRDFIAQADLIRSANPQMRVAFIAGAYQYRAGGRGMGGYFIPTTADDYYLDSYQRVRIRPAAKDPEVQNFIAELGRKRLHFNGFAEYGRGASAVGPPGAAAAAARAAVIATDAAWLKSQPDVNLWIYWYTPGLGSGKQWRFTDQASLQAWRSQAAAR